jgi:TolB-like protein
VAPAAPVPARRLGLHGRRPLFATLVLGFALGLGLLFGWSRYHASDRPSGARLIAVLPFENMGDSADAYFADGITDAVRGKLTSLSGLRVTASNSSSEYRRTSKTPREIARELGVDYLLVGKVRWAKSADGTSRVQVSPELIQASTEEAKWQQSFDAPLTDVFQMQSDIAGRVASALNVALGSNEQRQLSERPTQNLAAYNAYLRGDALDAFLQGDPVTLRQAIAFYERATALDPGFSLAWSKLSRSYSLAYANGVPTPEGAEMARKGAERAEALAPNSAEGFLALGDYHHGVTGDNARALAAYSEGLRVAPGNVELLDASVGVEQYLGKWDSALVHARGSVALDPRSANSVRRLGVSLLYLRHYPEARAAFDRGLALAPANLILLEDRAMTELAAGDLAAARAVVAAAPRDVDPASLVAYFANYQDLFWVLTDAQQQLLLRLTASQFDDDRATWGLVLAQTYRLRGDMGRARAYADTAATEFERQLKAAPNNPQLHVLRGLSLAYAGRDAEGIGEGERGSTLLPLAKNAFLGVYLQHQLVRIYLLTGRNEKAIDALEPLVKMPYLLSPGWLRIDPAFVPLRGNPRFERLVQSP